jgi:hypothetical protein
LKHPANVVWIRLSSETHVGIERIRGIDGRESRDGFEAILGGE